MNTGALYPSKGVIHVWEYPLTSTDKTAGAHTIQTSGFPYCDKTKYLLVMSEMEYQTSRAGNPKQRYMKPFDRLTQTIIGDDGIFQFEWNFASAMSSAVCFRFYFIEI